MKILIARVEHEKYITQIPYAALKSLLKPYANARISAKQIEPLM